MRHFAVAAAAFSLVAAPAVLHAQSQIQAAPDAQAAPAQTAQPLQMIAYSSSANPQNLFAGEDIDGRDAGSAPDGTISKAAPQYGGGYGGGRYHRYDNGGGFSHIAIEAGGGFTAPIGNDVNGGFTTLVGGPGNSYGTETWGGNFMVGGGWNFTKRFALLGEYSWNTNKIPGRTLSAVYNESGLFDQGIDQIGGNIHTQGVTAEGVYYYYNSNRHSYAGYVIGGGGYYHKSTNFTTPVVEESFYGEYEENETFSSYSDNAGGFNIGTGISFKPFGEYSHAKLFAEARYVFVDTPAESYADLTNNNVLHTGTEEYIPVTVGIRF